MLSLAIEVLSFCQQAKHSEHRSQRKILLLDEPDVHLHPDLQHRLIKLVSKATKENDIVTLITTHSTAVLGALDEAGDHVAFMIANASTDLLFRPISQHLKDVIPVFGAHPLTNVFNRMPILLVEGEDDVRIWQQAVRSSGGDLPSFFGPVLA